MRRRDIYWSLFYKPEKRQIDDLRTDYIEVAHELIPQKDQADWLVWREGFSAWKPLIEFPKLLIALREGGHVGAPSVPAPAPAARAKSPESSAPSPNTKPGGDASTVVAPKAATTVHDRLARQGNIDDSVQFDIADDLELGDRDMRYQKKWEFRILTTGAPIVNQTIDISNRGMNLRDPLPKGLPRYFNAEVQVGNTVVQMVCSEIVAKEGKASTRVRIEVNHQPNVLQSALISRE